MCLWRTQTINERDKKGGRSVKQRRATGSFGWGSWVVLHGGGGLTEKVTFEKNLKELKELVIQYL